ncbi:MAG: UDP-N-acetylenolpyruvoylglucosamine reductase [Bacteroidetes bacterium]|nr:MAG: UDP-N-acetylenolpyruvoylglucosamine reductase [Bacteroidota bacterium]
MEILKNYSLKALNSFAINVDAKYFARVASMKDLLEVKDFIVKNNCQFMILGGGSNILFMNDYDGIIVSNNLSGIEILGEDENHVYVKAQAGENWDDFVSWCVENNLAGLENLSLIPGSVGASPIQNIGAYGVEMKDHFVELEAFQWENSKVQAYSYDDCQFGYRNSIFKNEQKGKVVILSVTFRLDKKPIFKTAYGAIQEEIKRIGIEPISIKAIRDAVISIRESKLPDPEDIGNAGSFFKNPVITENHYQSLKKTYPKIVSYKLPDGSHKLAAGWLIDQAGWKGKREGDAGVHEKQALVLVNYRNATGLEIIQLAAKIEQSVKELFNVDLEREVNVVFGS